MELYNFFTDPIQDRKLLEELLPELKEVCHFVEIVDWPLNSHSNVIERSSIIGQMYGADTSVGDTDLLWVLSGIKYTWFDAFCPKINNIDS